MRVGREESVGRGRWASVKVGRWIVEMVESTEEDDEDAEEVEEEGDLNGEGKGRLEARGPKA